MEQRAGEAEERNVVAVHGSMEGERRGEEMR